MQWDWFTIQKILKKTNACPHPKNNQNQNQPKPCHLLKDYFKELILILNIESSSQNPRMGQGWKGSQWITWSKLSAPAGPWQSTLHLLKLKKTNSTQGNSSLSKVQSHFRMRRSNYASSEYFPALSAFMSVLLVGYISKHIPLIIF